MSIFAEIESLEQRVQQLLAQAGEYSSVDDFVGAYTQSILDALGGLSQRELAGLDLQQLVEDALEASADFINVNLAAEIQSGVNNVLAETATFYTARGLDIPDLAEAISRTEAVQELTELFTTNMAEMREEMPKVSQERRKISQHRFQYSVKMAPRWAKVGPRWGQKGQDGNNDKMAETTEMAKTGETAKIAKMAAMAKMAKMA